MRPNGKTEALGPEDAGATSAFNRKSFGAATDYLIAL
jgi:hypothetical protein